MLYQLLFEDRLPSLEQKYDSLLVKHNTNVHELATLDPTTTKKYLDWIIRRVLQGDHPSAELPDQLTTFERVKRHLPFSDINKYTFTTLATAVTDVPEVQTRKQMRDGEKRQLQSDNAIEVIHEDSNLQLLKFNTPDAARRYSRGTKWCTGYADTYEIHFNSYAQTNSSIYYARFDEGRYLICPGTGEVNGTDNKLVHGRELRTLVDHIRPYIDRMFDEHTFVATLTAAYFPDAKIAMVGSVIGNQDSNPIYNFALDILSNSATPESDAFCLQNMQHSSSIFNKYIAACYLHPKNYMHAPAPELLKRIMSSQFKTLYIKMIDRGDEAFDKLNKGTYDSHIVDHLDQMSENDRTNLVEIIRDILEDHGCKTYKECVTYIRDEWDRGTELLKKIGHDLLTSIMDRPSP